MTAAPDTLDDIYAEDCFSVSFIELDLPILAHWLPIAYRRNYYLLPKLFRYTNLR